MISPRKTPDVQELPLPIGDAWRALVALCIGFFMILLDQTIVAVATPALQAEFEASYSQTIWVTSAYLLTLAVPMLVAGRLGDRVGPNRLYQVGMAIFTASSLVCGLAPTIEALIVARAAQGFGASLLVPQTMAILSRVFPRNRLGSALGVWGTVAGLATLSGPLFGGILTSTVGWQWIFFVNVPIGLVSIVLVARWVPSFPRLERRIDPASIAVSMLAVFLIVFGLQEAETLDWGLLVWLMLGGGIALIVLFLVRQSTVARHGGEPVVPLRLFRQRNFSLGGAGIALMGFNVAAFPLPLMLYLQQVHGLDALKAGLMLVPQAVISAVLSPWVGRLVDRLHPGRLGAAGFVAMGGSIAVLIVLLVADAPLWAALIALSFQGLGHAFIWSPNARTTIGDLDYELAGAGSGVYNTVRQLGSVLGSSSIAALLPTLLGTVSPTAAFATAMALPAAAMAIAVVVALLTTNPNAPAAAGGRAD